MRIISGSLKGRRLNPPANLPVRPTTDMARESLFNILNNIVDFDKCSVLDLFAGTGAVSLEFISRGAKDVTSVDIHKGCTDWIKEASAQFGVGNIHVVRADVFDMMKRMSRQFDIVFADPPYDHGEVQNLPNLVFENDILTPEGLFVLEHSEKFDFSSLACFNQHRRYGRVNFSFFTHPQ